MTALIGTPAASELAIGATPVVPEM